MSNKGDRRSIFHRLLHIFMFDFHRGFRITPVDRHTYFLVTGN